MRGLDRKKRKTPKISKLPDHRMNSSLVGPRMKESVFKKVEIYWGTGASLDKTELES